MALTDLLQDFYRTTRSLMRPAFLGLALAYCGPAVDDSDSRGCRTDYDCREQRVCEDGVCVNLKEEADYDRKSNSGNEKYEGKREQNWNACKGGEVLFEDEFNGRELNLESWDEDYINAYSRDMRLNNGMLEMPMTDIDARRTGVSLRSAIYFELSDYESVCLSGRLRVREREGTGFCLMMSHNNEYRFYLSENSGTLYCGPRGTGGAAPTCSVKDATKFHTYTIEYQYRGGFPEDMLAYYIDGERQRLAENKFSSSGFRIRLRCSSQGNMEESVCFIDHVRVMGLRKL